ncbi:MAG: hypothetical protein HYY30_01925 [Chloroflexi bacterium]|nr:hypothetical protein [Chloroflexota bacterium]
MRINLGVPVYLSDGQKGTVIDRVIVDPKLWEVTHLVVGKGVDLAEPKLVPLNEVQSWSNDRVNLRLTLQQLANMPAYVEQQYCKPCVLLGSAKEPGKGKVPTTDIFTQEGFPYGPSTIPHKSKPMKTHEARHAQPEVGEGYVGPIELQNGAQVEAVDGPVGTLDQLLLDTYIGRVTYIVVSAPGLRDHELRIPVEWVGYLEPTRIRLAATKQHLKDLVGPPAGNYLSVKGNG